MLWKDSQSLLEVELHVGSVCMVVLVQFEDCRFV